MKKLPVWIVVLILSLFALPLTAAETILHFFSDIEVHPDGSMTVTETIKVRAEGRQIKRGIYRDFPTDYKDRLGNNLRVGFELQSVLRDGAPENHFIERQKNGVRIYFGQEDVYLKTGVYTYTMTYRTHRQLGYFADHDELYWNVTGNGWAFSIQQAGARVSLPYSVTADQIRMDGYSGRQGSTAREFSGNVGLNGEVVFETTAPLYAGEGLTIVVAWPKGHVQEPDSGQRLAWFFSDNRDALIGFVGILLLLAYYLISWMKVGKDPDAGVIIPLYEPPQGFSPAAVRFISRMGYDDRALTAAIINMAVEGYVTINEDEGGDFELVKSAEKPKLAAGEKAAANALFAGRRTRLKMEQEKHEVFSRAIDKHKASLKRDYEKRYFITNRLYIIPGILISLLTAVMIIWSLPGEDQKLNSVIMVLWLSGWTIAVFLLVKNMLSAWRTFFRSRRKILSALGATIFVIPFLAGEVAGAWVVGSEGSVALLLALLLMLSINYLFYEWMKAPTLMGRKLIDKIEGFKLYLTVAEQEELNRHNPTVKRSAMAEPPIKTPELFERYLPYAIALDVEHEWGEQFVSVLQQARSDNQDYHPAWYHGSHWDSRDFTTFTAAVGAGISSAISSSSTAPGSSSGVGGGGFSGGGGGGGGGGGW